ncbi:MAG: DUF1223 domain-containing protein [Wenzhouxiangellaceae bacterium]
MKIKLSTALALTLLTATTRAETLQRCHHAGQENPPQLVELYTSEGCSSCPPADAWLAQVGRHDNIIALAFHVDYWNALGWHDRFSDQRYSQRQRDIARHNHQRSIYTPEIVVNGREHRHWHADTATTLTSGSNRRALPTEPLQHWCLSVEQHERGGLRISWTEAVANSEPVHTRLAITESKLETQVQAGENRSRRLRHDYVVRWYFDQLEATGSLSITLPPEVRPRNTRIVAWRERPASGELISVLELDLAAFGKR